MIDLHAGFLRAQAWAWQRPRERIIAWSNRAESRRLDRERTYVWVHIGLLMVGLGIFLRPKASGVLAVLGDNELRVLALMMSLGSALCLWGAATPTGPDVRRIYGLAVAGQLSVVASLMVYTQQILIYSDLVGTLGGGLSITIGCSCIQIAAVAAKEVRRIERLRRHE